MIVGSLILLACADCQRMNDEMSHACCDVAAIWKEMFVTPFSLLFEFAKFGGNSV